MRRKLEGNERERRWRVTRVNKDGRRREKLAKKGEGTIDMRERERKR